MNRKVGGQVAANFWSLPQRRSWIRVGVPPPTTPTGGKVHAPFLPIFFSADFSANRSARKADSNSNISFPRNRDAATPIRNLVGRGSGGFFAPSRSLAGHHDYEAPRAPAHRSCKPLDRFGETREIGCVVKCQTSKANGTSI